MPNKPTPAPVFLPEFDDIPLDDIFVSGWIVRNFPDVTYDHDTDNLLYEGT